MLSMQSSPTLLMLKVNTESPLIFELKQQYPSVVIFVQGGFYVRSEVSCQMALQCVNLVSYFKPDHIRWLKVV